MQINGFPIDIEVDEDGILFHVLHLKGAMPLGIPSTKHWLI